MTPRTVTTCASDIRCGDVLDGCMIVALVTNHVDRVVAVTTGHMGNRKTITMDFDEVVELIRGVHDIRRLGGPPAH